ncbi:MAG TPA: hypothetical protein VGJ21_11460 [Terracidiphilus sp.]
MKLPRHFVVLRIEPVHIKRAALIYCVVRHCVLAGQKHRAQKNIRHDSVRLCPHKFVRSIAPPEINAINLEEMPQFAAEVTDQIAC